jgi:hypothetical protein
MKNTIDLMEQSLEKHQLKDCIPDNARKKQSENPSLERGKGHALMVISFYLNSWVFDSKDTITWPHRIDFFHTWRLVPDHQSSWEMILLLRCAIGVELI